jgi:6,7-dimethyl-8-ribityllumazine synthase
MHFEYICDATSHAIMKVRLCAVVNVVHSVDVVYIVDAVMML